MSDQPDIQEISPARTPRRVNPWILLLFVMVVLVVVGIFAIKLSNSTVRITDNNPAPDFTIKTYGGEPTDLTDATIGDGLMLIGGDGRPNFTLPAVTRFIFVRPRPKPQVDDRASFR